MKKKKIILAVILRLAVIGYSVSFVHVNREFPHGTVTEIGAKETITYHEMQYTIQKGALYTGSELKAQYGYDEIDEKDNVMVVQFQITNPTGQDQKVEVMDMVGINGTWANGPEYALFWYLNGDDFDAVIPADTTGSISVGFLINTDLKKLMQQKTLWMVQIGGWPDRCDMIVELTEDETV